MRPGSLPVLREKHEHVAHLFPPEPSSKALNVEGHHPIVCRRPGGTMGGVHLKLWGGGTPAPAFRLPLGSSAGASRDTKLGGPAGGRGLAPCGRWPAAWRDPSCWSGRVLWSGPGQGLPPGCPETGAKAPSIACLGDASLLQSTPGAGKPLQTNIKRPGFPRHYLPFGNL